MTDPKKLGGLLRTIDTYNGQKMTAFGLELLALLVPRLGELRQARWEEVSFEKSIWSIPASRIKCGGRTAFRFPRGPSPC